MGYELYYDKAAKYLCSAASNCLLKLLVLGASKIKLKNVNKKRMATARRLNFLEFLKASIAVLIRPLFSSLQNSEGGGGVNSGDSCADPCQFLPFPKTKI